VFCSQHCSALQTRAALAVVQQLAPLPPFFQAFITAPAAQTLLVNAQDSVVYTWHAMHLINASCI
jgi:hypothetical protein